MDFIIDFFRSIDGVLYYIILIVNTILIFAIIGYLGEKNNEKLLKMSMAMGESNLKSGTMNLSITHTSTHSNSVIPTVEATQMENMPNADMISNFSGSAPAVGITQNEQVIPNVVLNQQSGVVNNQPNNTFVNPSEKPVIRPEDNEVDPNEKAPSVLIINSSDVNNGAK